MNDINSLSHSRWRCKYHIVFAPKYRRQEIYGDIRKDNGVILRKLCEQKKVFDLLRFGVDKEGQLSSILVGQLFHTHSSK